MATRGIGSAVKDVAAARPVPVTGADSVALSGSRRQQSADALPQATFTSADDRGRKMVALRLAKAGKLTTAEFSRRFNTTNSQARYFILNDGAAATRGPPRCCSREEEEVLVKYLRVNAVIGRGLSCENFCKVCGDYFVELSAERQATARRYFRGRATPCRGFLQGFLRRWPMLREYRAGKIEEGRAWNGRPKVVAHWFAALSLLYRDLGIKSSRQVWNMDEMHVKS